MASTRSLRAYKGGAAALIAQRFCLQNNICRTAARNSSTRPDRCAGQRVKTVLQGIRDTRRVLGNKAVVGALHHLTVPVAHFTLCASILYLRLLYTTLGIL